MFSLRTGGLKGGTALVALSVSLAFIVSGCDRGKPIDSEPPPTTGKGLDAGAIKPASSSKGSLVLTLTADRSRFREMEPVGLKLRLANKGGDSVILNWNSGQRFDLIIEDSGGKEVYRWSRGHAFIQMLVEQTLGPGKAEELEAEWDQKDLDGRPVAPGDFTVKGRSLARQAPPEVELRLSVGD